MIVATIFTIDPSRTERFNNRATKESLYSGKQRLRLALPLLILLSTLLNVNHSPKSSYELAIMHAMRFALPTENSVSRSHFFRIPFLEKENSEAGVALQANLIMNVNTNYE